MVTLVNLAHDETMIEHMQVQLESGDYYNRYKSQQVPIVHIYSVRLLNLFKWLRWFCRQFFN